MSRSAPLPPRCPFQNRGALRGALDSPPQPSLKDDSLCAQPHAFSSHGSLLYEQPPWLDDLLTDPHNSPKGVTLRRSSSDPVALLEVAKTFHGSISPVIEEDALSDSFLHESLECEETSEIGSRFEAGNCVYGPNSPRQKGKLIDSESSIMTSFMENSPSNPLQYLTVDYPTRTSVISEPRGTEDYIPSGNLDPEKISRRYLIFCFQFFFAEPLWISFFIHIINHSQIPELVLVMSEF